GLDELELPAGLRQFAGPRRWLIIGLMASICLALMVALTAPPFIAWLATALTLVVVAIMLAVSVVSAGKAVEAMAQQTKMYTSAKRTSQQVEELFAMTDMLQAAEDHDDAGAVLMSTAQRLLPDFGGALYVFNNSRDRLDLAKSWNTSEGFHP